MKNRKIWIVTGMLVILLVGIFFGYKYFNPAEPDRKILYYQSGMHPWIKSDKPGKCPLCGMDLVPVYEDDLKVGAKDPKVNRVQLAANQLKHLNVRTETVDSLSLFKEIRTVGVVAYDPELVVAQEEFIAALETQSLASAARRKLRILGLSTREINRLERRRRADTNLLLPEYRMWVYADVYEEEMGWIVPGTRVKVLSVAYPGQEFRGWISSLEPVLDAKTRSAKVRIQVLNPGLKLKPQMYVDVYLKSKPKNALAVDKAAILNTGERKVAYVQIEPGLFEMRHVKIGAEYLTKQNKDKKKYLTVLKGLSKGEKVVVGANFLIDSQSQLTSGSSSLYGGAQEVEK